MPNPPDIRILSIDTATRRGSVALQAGSDTAAELRLSSLETHSARLLRSIEYLLEATGWAMGDLGLVASGIGPGSFTGIRIGVSTGMGLAQTLRIPFVGISAFDSLSARFSFLDRPLGIVLDAQRGQVYFGEYDYPLGRPKCVVAPSLWEPEELARRLARRRVYLVGDGLYRVAQVASGGVEWPRVAESELFLARDIARLALKRTRAWRRDSFVSAEPLYIRPPDALKPKARA
jgi:tRNA threonylcarbamoyladenosine biosynthesis protein TsaB